MLYKFLYYDSEISAVIKNIEDGDSFSVVRTCLPEMIERNQIINPEDIEKEQPIKYNRRSDIKLFGGADLDKYLSNTLGSNIVHERDFVNQIRNSDRKVVIVSGIRRTGKTIGVQQYLRSVRENNISACYIVLIKKIDSNTLFDFIEANCQNYNVICIDEITKCIDFAEASSWVSDYYVPAYNKEKVVLTGTDSYALELASTSGLLDRTTYINTSVVLYSEYKRIRNKSFKDYLDAATLYSQTELSFNTLTDLLSVTICNNISESLYVNNKDMGMSKDELTYYVFYALIKQSINSYTRDNLVGDNPVTDKETRKRIRGTANRQVLEDLVANSQIKFNKATFKTVVQMMHRMGVLVGIPNILIYGDLEFYVAIPGVNCSIIRRYNSKILSICNAEGLTMDSNNTVYGRIYECLIATNLKKAGYDVYTCRNENGTFEIDLVVKTDNYYYLLEVKSKSTKAADDFRHLRNLSVFEEQFNDLPTKTFVLYMGESETKGTDCYLNIEEFLLNYITLLK